MKKVISILVSVMMILTAIPAFADTVAAAPASVDVYEALDNFSAEELATTYTSSAPYTTASGFKAPASVHMDATIMEDETVGKYFHLVPSDGFASASNDYRGGVAFSDPDNLRLGTTHKVFTTSVTLRQNVQTNLYWYFYKSDGKTLRNYPLRWWGTAGFYSTMSGAYVGGSSKTPLAVDTWYTITYTMDLNQKTIRVVVDGGNYDNIAWTGTLSDSECNSIINNEPVGVGVGYFSAETSATSLDIANMSFSTSGSMAYDEKLTFENGTLNATATSWKSGNWKVGHSSHVTTWQPTPTYIGGIHQKAVAIKGGYNNNFWFVHTIPDKTVDSDGVLIVEGSYYEEDYAYMDIELQGVSGASTTRLYPIINEKLGEWTKKCMGTKIDDNGDTLTMPRRSGWIRTRVISNLKTDTLTLQYWLESDPEGTLVTATREGALADYDDINAAWIKVYSTADDYQYIDDLRIYTSDTLRYMGSNPVNGGANAVSVTDDPSLIFNMPIANYTGTMTLKDSDGNAVAGTVGLNAQRNGIAFYPTSDLKGEETYTLTANCAVTDVFGSTVNVAKTITFTTEPVLTLVDFEFSKDVVTAGELGATIEVKAEDRLARNIYAALAIYNKTTNELVSINTGSINAVTNTFNLTAEVPAEGTYYAKAFVWNTDAKAVPYFTAQTIGLE